MVIRILNTHPADRDAWLALLASAMENPSASECPLTERTGYRAYELLKQIRAFDALIAATAMEQNCVLPAKNRKHFTTISALQLELPAIDPITQQLQTAPLRHS
jgi:hypothetical protein